MKNKNIVIISSLEWSTQRQVVHEFTEHLSKNNKVLFIENTGVRSIKLKDSYRLSLALKKFLKFRKLFYDLQSNITSFRPIFLPFFPYNRFIIFINKIIINLFLKSWIKFQNYKNVVCFCFLPTPLAQNIVNCIKPDFLFYYCIDNLEYSSSDKKKFIKFEKNFSQRVNLNICTSLSLFNKIKQNTDKVLYVPSGVDYDKMSNTNNNLEIKDQILFESLTGPIFGFVGSIRDIIDYNFIRHIIKNSNGEAKIIFVGPIIDTPPEDIKDHDNIYFLGNKNHDLISCLINKFDYCIIPYKINEFTNAIYPTKINEYLALGKPVISTPVAEVLEFNKNNNNIIDIFETYLKNNNFSKKSNLTLDDLNFRKEIAKKNSWKQRFEIIDDKIDKIITSNDTITKDWNLFFQKQIKQYILNFGKKLSLLILILSLLFYLDFFSKIENNLIYKNLAPLNTQNILVMSGIGGANYYNLSFQDRFVELQSYIKNKKTNNLFIFGRKYKVEESNIIELLVQKEKLNINNIVLINDHGKNLRDNLILINLKLKKENIKEINIICEKFLIKRINLLWNKLDTDIKISFIQSNFQNKIKQSIFQKVYVIIYEYLAISYNFLKGWI